MTHFLASGLSLGTEYEFTVRAINALGESAYQAHAVYARTDAAAPVTDELHDDLPLVVILVVSLFVLLLIAVNVFLIICCIRRRQRKLDKGKLMDSDQRSTFFSARALDTLAPTKTQARSS